MKQITNKNFFKYGDMLVLIDDKCLKIIKQEYDCIDDFIDMLLDSFDLTEVALLNIFYNEKENMIDFIAHI